MSFKYRKSDDFKKVVNNQSKYSSGQGSCFGTFRELLQGVLYENDVDFLVTFPIECYTRTILI
ncbi:hypothetical protein [Abyssisolibacter fermentans]|uniref:hypothetical protein n=1 Tax=Abyssisolibacter fermentans TaxID=1766203 RepID=UPI00192E50E6|nr:hypothetical protein [Abyssisolibacter fermentans]